MHQRQLVSLLVVSDDWLFRSRVVMAAEETGRFAPIEAVADAYDALVAVWDHVTRCHSGFDAVLFDLRVPDPAVYTFIDELRDDSATMHAYIAALNPDGVIGQHLFDQVAPCSVLDPELGTVLTGLAEFAQWRAATKPS